MTVAVLPSERFPPPTSDDRRRQPRTDTDVIALVREVGRSGAPCTVRDFSSEGCRLHGCDLAPDAEIWIKFSGIAPVRARVVWAHSGLAGCRFYEPLSALMITLARLEPTDET